MIKTKVEEMGSQEAFTPNIFISGTKAVLIIKDEPSINIAAPLNINHRGRFINFSGSVVSTFLFISIFQYVDSIFKVQIPSLTHNFATPQAIRHYGQSWVLEVYRSKSFSNFFYGIVLF
jgi:hypothetical protein